MSKNFILIIFALLQLFMMQVKASETGTFVKNVARSVISLNGKWEICLDPKDFLQGNRKAELTWKSILVPGECMMQGFQIEHDKPVVYKRKFIVPHDYSGKIIKLKFEGIYSYARIWVNGKYIRDHWGGFTPWESDITESVIPGKETTLFVEVTDKADEISYASGYAKHLIGGILRSVSLMALPKSYPERVTITTDFDQSYRDASLKIIGMVRKTSLLVQDRKMNIELSDPLNHPIALINKEVTLNDSLFQITNIISDPLKWDAEHPNLYKLKLSLTADGKVIWRRDYSIGFREIEVKGNRFLVNGREIKLRGACRHDIHPLLGRVSTPDYELKDVLLAKEANINFIRTSHYPPTDNFLQLCDKYGIYVEDETAVCFVDTYRSPEYAPGATENAPEYSERYLSQLNEMVENHRNHPSVIMWSIGNENKFGSNFGKSYEWVKQADPTRPVIFSFPGTDKSVGKKSYEILSMHYPGIDGSLEQFGTIVKGFNNERMPVLFDEWAHVACYNSSIIREDPNVRDFWGRSLDSMWIKTFDSSGGLGGAIWGMIDETFMLPKHISKTVAGYGEWGIIDTWRRKKPEFWNVKKAYSPVRVLQTEFNDYHQGQKLSVPVYNRYDCSNLNELKIKYYYEGNISEFKAPSIPLHSKGFIDLPINEWKAGKPIQIDFIDKNDRIVDAYLLRMIVPVSQESNNASGKIIIDENQGQYLISCENKLQFVINKSTGLFSHYNIAGRRNEFSGPWLNCRTKARGSQTSSTQFNDFGKDWKLNKISITPKDNLAEVITDGSFAGKTTVSYSISILPQGNIIVRYIVNNLPKEYLRETGIKFMLPNDFKSLAWERNGYWSYYPVGHLSDNKGEVLIFSNKQNDYRGAPLRDWQNDTKSFYYNGYEDEKEGVITFAARSTKENIYMYHLKRENPGGIMVQGTGKEGCRLTEKEGRIELIIDNYLDYPDLAWGNYQKNIFADKCNSGTIKLTVKTK